MLLKPHDTIIALKYGTLALSHIKGSGNHPTDPIREKLGSARWMSDALAISPGEISKSNRRLMATHLITETRLPGSKEDGVFPYQLVTRNMQEWLLYGIRYYSQPEPLGMVRGTGTGWSCEFLESDMVPPAPPWVWPKPGGDLYGEGIEPIYQGVPHAAFRDKYLYRVLALIDIMRIGKPRELAIAKDLITSSLKDIASAQF